MFRRITSRIAAARSHRADIRTLRRMDDRQLADIGVARGDIETAVRHGRF